LEPEVPRNPGVDIKNDSEGVMQDTHWASGLYGYFPTYAIGNIYSGQIMAQSKMTFQTGEANSHQAT
jgi:carboxypeptidase Taq